MATTQPTPQKTPQKSDPKAALHTRPKQIVPPDSFVAHGVTPVAGAAAPVLTNHGGTVLQSVQVIPIYWGAAWATGANAALPAQLDAFFDFILTSSMMDLLAEFSIPGKPIQHGSRPTSVHVPTSEPGTATATGRLVTDAQIQAQLRTWIGNNTVPATTPNTLYFVYLPPNVVCNGPAGAGASCNQFCGYHDAFDGNVFYAVIPFANCQGCVFPGAMLDTLTEVSSHELSEAITDPALGTWFDPNTGNEIGDICNRHTVRLGNFLVQTEWSNQQGACVIAPSAGGHGKHGHH